MILVRHGQSEFNAAFNRTRIDPGIVDPRLTGEGRAQASAVAVALGELGIRRLIASPYTRALETAAVIAEVLGTPIGVEPLVRERSAFTCDIGTPAAELPGAGRPFALTIWPTRGGPQPKNPRTRWQTAAGISAPPRREPRTAIMSP